MQHITITDYDDTESYRAGYYIYNYPTVLS